MSHAPAIATSRFVQVVRRLYVVDFAFPRVLLVVLVFLHGSSNPLFVLRDRKANVVMFSSLRLALVDFFLYFF